MNGINFESECALSINSIEDNDSVYTIIINSPREYIDLSNSSKVTVPFYKGDVSIEDIKKLSAANGQKLRPDVSSSNNLFGNKKCHSARNKNCPRTSIIQENQNSVRLRNRSVSYLEQFRRKHYGTSQTTTSTISIGGSDGEEQEKSMTNYDQEDKSVTSEFEYYLGLTKNIENKDESLSSATSLSKPKNYNRKNKV